MRATDKRMELLPPQLNAREIRLDGVFTRYRYETMNIIRKGQVEGIRKGDIREQVRFMADLFKVAA